MAEKMKLYDLTPSPNNIKVRLALNYKEIPFEKISVDPNNRAELVRVSGQPLTPVLIHDDRIIYDSSAILRYLEANVRREPRIFSEEYAVMQEIERWEMLGRTEISKPISMTFRQAFAEKKDPAEMDRASRLLNDVSGVLEDRLSKAKWLVGDRMTAADITIAPIVNCGMIPTPAADASPLVKFFAANLKLGSGRDRTREWTGRVMAYDR